MLPWKFEGARSGYDDYLARFAVLESAGILVRPDLKRGAGLGFSNEPLLRELSFALFCGWLYSGLFNASKAKVRLALVPAADVGARSLLVVSRLDTPLAPPGRVSAGPLDADYFRCPIDVHGVGRVPHADRIFCPVLNRLRFNLGNSGRPAGEFAVPAKSETCCGGNKASFWDYMDANVMADPGKYGGGVGGIAIPVEVPFDLLRNYLTGLDFDTDTLGRRFEETLLWYGQNEAGALQAIAHSKFTQPIESNELDFALVFCGSSSMTPKDAPNGDWRAFAGTHQLCVFELTLGHQVEGSSSTERGSDHPKNKIVNHLALTSGGWGGVHYHYLSVRGDQEMSPALEQVLTAGMANFSYWKLSDEHPKIVDLTVNAFDEPVPVATLREWHAAVVDRVVQAARAFRVEFGGP